MYILISLADVVQIHPSDFSKSSARAIEDFINTKYADKVIHKVGLCVGFHSIISTSEGLIGHGSGIVNVNVDFRLIVYRPFKGEIVQARIMDSNAKGGVYLSQDFFEDITVPPHLLFDDTKWEKDERSGDCFVWRPKDQSAEVKPGEDKPEGGPYYFDQAEGYLCRIEQEVWRDLSPQMQRSDQNFVADQPMDDNAPEIPYAINASMTLSGLGAKYWWTEEVDAVAVDDHDAAELPDDDEKMVLENA